MWRYRICMMKLGLGKLFMFSCFFRSVPEGGDLRESKFITYYVYAAVHNILGEIKLIRNSNTSKICLYL